MDPATRSKIFQQTLKVVTSYRLAAVILVLLTFLTLLGTLNQIDESIYHTQKKYFESAFVVDKVGWFPVFLPGGYLLMSILFVIMLCGTLVKMRRNWKAVGLHIVHFGILFLIVSAAVTMHFAEEGNMALRPGMEGDEVLSFHYWQMEIIPVDEEGNASEAFVIPFSQLRNIGWNGQRKFTSEELPFDLVINRFARNSFPIAADTPKAKGRDEGEVISGYKLRREPLAEESERNLAGAYVEFVPKNGGESQEAIIFAHLGGNLSARTAYPLEVDGQTFAVQIARERFRVPYTLRVEQFIFDKYAGVATAKNYQSNVTKIEAGEEETHIIKMNEPLRHRGFTFFQASFGPSADAPEDELYPVFQVVRNPSDHWPQVSMWIVMFGLFFHLVVKLVQYLNKSSRSPKTATQPATEAAESPAVTTTSPS